MTKIYEVIQTAYDYEMSDRSFGFYSTREKAEVRYEDVKNDIINYHKDRYELLLENDKKRAKPLHGYKSFEEYRKHSFLDDELRHLHVFEHTLDEDI